MRLLLVVATLFVILLVLFTGDQSSAQIGGNVDTDTALTIPSNLVNGDSITINSMTTFVGGPVFNGHTTFYHINDIRVKGDTDFGTSISITDPTFQFDVSSSMTLRVIRIPIISISTDAVIKWNISESVGPVLAEGEININELLYMQQLGNLMLVLGSLQSDDLNNDNKYASGITLTTGSYKITLSQSLVLDFESKASNTYQGVYAYENDILQNTYSQLYLMGGSHRERIATVNGAASSS